MSYGSSIIRDHFHRVIPTTRQYIWKVVTLDAAFTSVAKPCAVAEAGGIVRKIVKICGGITGSRV